MGFSIEEIIDLANKHYQENGRDNVFSKLENMVKKSKNPYSILDFAMKVEGADINGLSKVMAQTNWIRGMYEFAKRFNSVADIKALQDTIIRGCFSVKDGEELNIETFQNAKVNSQYVRFLYFFARDVEGADIKILSKAMSKTNNAQYIYYFLRDIKEPDKEILTKSLLETKDKRCIRCFELLNEKRTANLANEWENKNFQTHTVDKVGNDTEFSYKTQKNDNQTLSNKDLEK